MSSGKESGGGNIGGSKDAGVQKDEKPPSLDLSLDLPGSTPIGSHLSLSQLGSNLSIGLPGSTSLGSGLSLGQLGPTPPVAPSQTAAASTSRTRSQRKSTATAINFPFTKIIIGDWTQETAGPRDLVAKCYFAKRQIVWELRVEEQKENKTMRFKKRMEMSWASILSLKASEGILQVELDEAPKFFQESDDLMSNANWKPIEYFSPNHPSSVNRRHTLHLDPQVLQKNYDLMLAGDNFWSTLPLYPSLPELTFAINAVPGNSSVTNPEASLKRKDREDDNEEREDKNQKV